MPVTTCTSAKIHSDKSLYLLLCVEVGLKPSIYNKISHSTHSFCIKINSLKAKKIFRQKLAKWMPKAIFILSLCFLFFFLNLFIDDASDLQISLHKKATFYATPSMIVRVFLPCKDDLCVVLEHVVQRLLVHVLG